MRVAHLLRKYNQAEWGGTETAIERLLSGLLLQEVKPLVYCPRIGECPVEDPLARQGIEVRRFGACVPIWGISPEEKRQMIAVGGNLISFSLPLSLLSERNLSLIHTHTLGRIGGIALSVARWRRIPCVATIHGGVLDLPEHLRANLNRPLRRGVEWGKAFGAVFGSRRVLVDADAIITCNPREAALLQQQYPTQRVMVQPHGVPVELYSRDHRAAARAAFPQIAGRPMLLNVGRIDPFKNQGWLIEHLPALVKKHPRLVVVLAGACTNESYGEQVQSQIQQLGLENHIVMTGGLLPSDPRLIGLFQEARALILPSVSETFGLVLLEAWAAGTAVIASRTSGASALIQHGENGWIFDLNDPGAFVEAAHQALLKPELAARLAAAGHRLCLAEYNTQTLAGRMKRLYEQLIEEKHALRHTPRR